jgi:SAM-dependent methyltransferase
MQHIYKNKNFGENWFDDGEQFYNSIIKKYESGSHFVEVGCWKGKSAAYLIVEIINSGKNIKVDCVDTWDPFINEDASVYFDKGDLSSLYETFLNNMNPIKDYYTPIRMRSTEAAKLYKDDSLDFIFIDACHYYECVDADIKAWYPKLKKGGIISGHDFSNNWPGVKKAVEENFKQYKTTNPTIWYVEK